MSAGTCAVRRGAGHRFVTLAEALGERGYSVAPSSPPTSTTSLGWTARPNGYNPRAFTPSRLSSRLLKRPSFTTTARTASRSRRRGGRSRCLPKEEAVDPVQSRGCLPTVCGLDTCRTVALARQPREARGLTVTTGRRAKSTAAMASATALGRPRLGWYLSRWRVKDRDAASGTRARRPEGKGRSFAPSKTGLARSKGQNG